MNKFMKMIQGLSHKANNRPPKGQNAPKSKSPGNKTSRFKENIQAKTPTEQERKAAIRNSRNAQLKKYSEFRENPYIRNYFNHVVAAIMISQYENYEQSGINIPYRYKAHKSTRDKVDKRLKKATFSYTENGDLVVDNVEPLLDIFAIEIVSRRRPTITTSNNPEIQKLLDEQKHYQRILEEFQGFKGKLLKNDLKPAKGHNFKFECTKIEYYEKCKEILEKLKQIIHPNATELKAHYDELIDTINERIELVVKSGLEDKIVDVEDYEDKEVNFFSLLSEYESRIYNKTELAILTEQITSLFEDNPMFESLGISLSDVQVEEKRTERGFESNFMYIDTPVGRIECQLQTESQYRFGNFGFAAHTKMTGKKVERVQIPKTEELKRQLKDLISKLKDISPDSYLARMDDNERGRVMISEYGTYQNYHKIISQTAKGDKNEKYLYDYIKKLYVLRDKLDKEERSLGFIETDIEEYIDSDEFKQFLEIAPSLNKDNLAVVHNSSNPTNPSQEESRNDTDNNER